MNPYASSQASMGKKSLGWKFFFQSLYNFGIVTTMDDWNVRKIANAANLIEVYQ